MTFAIRKTALLLGAAALFLPAAAYAQLRDLGEARGAEQLFESTVEGKPAEFRLRIPADSQVQIDVMTTSELDPVVKVSDAVTGELIAEDDDSGGDLNSRVRIRGVEARQVVIAVDGFNADWVEEGESYGGSFDLKLSTSAYVPVVARAISYGARETGQMQGEPHKFTFNASAGQMIEVALLAGEDGLDPYLQLEDAEGQLLAEDDDGGQDLNSLLSYIFDADGTYTIIASGLGESSGDYTLRMRESRAPVAQLPLQVIGIGDQATGELGSPWVENSLMLSQIDYQLSDAAKSAIRRGKGAVTIRMNAIEGDDPDFSGSIDPYIEVGFETPLGFAVVETDDDGSGTLDAQLPIDLGLIADKPSLLDMLRIRVQGLDGSGGAYALSITEGMDARVEPNYGDFEGMEEAMDAAAEAAADLPED